MVMWPFPPTRETESPACSPTVRSRGEGGGSAFSGLSDLQGRHGCPGRTAFPSLTLSAAGWLCVSVPLSVCRENAPVSYFRVRISDLTSLPCLRAKFLPLFRALRAVAPFQKTVPPGAWPLPCSLSGYTQTWSSLRSWAPPTTSSVPSCASP